MQSLRPDRELTSGEWAQCLYRSLLTARQVDEREQRFVTQNLAHFHVSGAGHEASAALAAHLTEHDWLHLHYRDKALMLARGLPVKEFFRSLLCRGGSHSSGRQMSAHLSAPHLHITSLVGPVGNNSLQAVGVAAAIKDRPERPIVVCSVGDGTTQEGEFLEAVAEAVRWQLPVLFLIEDNRYSISTPTRGKTFFDLPTGPAADFYGLTIHRVDGHKPVGADTQFQSVVTAMRESRRPEIVILEVERLSNHTNADDQALYRDAEEISRGRVAGDPLITMREILLNRGSSAAELDTLEQEVERQVEAVADEVLLEAEPTSAFDAKAPLTPEFLNRQEYRGNESLPRLTMREAICGVLRERLSVDPRVFLYGEDIEEPKGDVFGVTRGLSTEFPGRVVNSPLSESTIIGTSIGRALAGQRPVAFIQFADFLPLAFNQILSELGSMYWRTNGGWECPVIVMVTCGGYKPGLGPFHAQTLESVMAHTPGIDVIMPSSAGDAAGLLNAAFESARPTIFFYPKSCLNLEDRATSPDVEQQFAPLGKARRLRSGSELTLVTWGSPVQQCLQTADALAVANKSVDLFDLRSLSPWDAEIIIASAEKTGRMVVVHEDNSTCGFGAEVIATVVEKAKHPVVARRVCRADTYIPCNFRNQLEVLPSFRRILETCADLFGQDVEWLREVDEDSGIGVVRAIGSGPADDRVEVVELLVQAGDTIEIGQVVAIVEATKSVVDVASTVAGRVVEIVAKVGDRVLVDQPLLRVQLTNSAADRPPTVTHEDPGRPLLRTRSPPKPLTLRSRPRCAEESLSMAPDSYIYLSRAACVLGSRIVTTEAIAEHIPGWTAAEAIKRTGVERRHWIAEGETAVSLTTRAANQLLDSLGSNAPKISAVLCSTTSPQMATPSIACQVATNLRSRNCFSEEWYAFDFNAACSGFLYGLRLAWDHLRSENAEAVLLLTSEILSPLLDKTDPTTAFLFGDAVSATLISRIPSNICSFGVRRPLLLSSPDPDLTISSPCFSGPGSLRMDGIAVARTAYKHMIDVMNLAGAQLKISNDSLAAILPHPGSKRILQNVAEFAEIPFSRVKHTLNHTGNTSSTSIPLAIDSVWNQLPHAQNIGLVSFGAGYTSAAAVGEIN